MTAEQFDKADVLLEQLDRANELLKNTKEQKCEWIYFTFGNGSNHATVCEEEVVIEEIRRILIRAHEMKIQQLTTEFESI